MQNNNDSSKPLFKKSNILPLEQLSIYVKIIFMHDYINLRTPASFRNLWKRNRDVNHRQLRNKNDFHIPRSKKAIEKFPLYNFQKLWNDICENDLLNEAIPRKLFCKTLKTYLMITIE